MNRQERNEELKAIIQALKSPLPAEHYKIRKLPGVYGYSCLGRQSVITSP